MTLHRLVALLRRRLLLIVVGVVLGVGAAAAYTWQATPVYATSAQLYVSTTTQDKTGSELVNAGLYANSQVNSFAAVVTTAAVLDDVITRLGLDTTPEELAGQISVSVPLNTVVLRVEVRDPEPKRAADIANAVADELPSVVERLTRPRADATPPTRLNLLQSAAVPQAKLSPNPKLNLVAGLMIGLLLGLGLAVVAEAFRRRVSSVVEIEEAMGAPVLGVLPDHRGEASGAAGADATRLVWTSMLAAVGHAPRAFLLASLSESAAPRLVGRLAEVVVESERTVAWVDADLRGARATAALDLPRSPGLADLLRGESSVDEIVLPWRDSALCLVPAGTQQSETTRFYANPAMGRLVETLRDGFETVVIDGMSTTTVAELAMLAQYVEATVLVVTPDVTRHVLAQSARELRASGVRVVGVVVDDVRERDRPDFERRLLSELEVIADY